MIAIETGTGKTRFFRDVIAYIEYTEIDFQKIVADDLGSYLDPGVAKVEIGVEGYIEIDGLPEIPNEEYHPEKGWRVPKDKKTINKSVRKKIVK